MMKKITTIILLFSILASHGIAQHSERGYLGIHSNTVHSKKAKRLNFESANGAYVTRVLENSASAKNGLQPFDYIYQVNQEKLTEERRLTSILGDYKPGDRVKVDFVRQGQKMSKEFALGKKSDGRKRARSDEEDPLLGIGQSHDKIPDQVVGIPVNIVRNSTAQKMGMKSGDIITEVNGYPIYDWHDVSAAIDMMEVGEEIEVKYLRGDMANTVTRPIQSVEETHNPIEEEEEIAATSPTENEQPNVSTNPVDEQEILNETEIAEESSTLDISMENVPEADANEMKVELGIDMPLVQNLSIEALNIFPNPNRGIFNLEFTLPNTGPTIIRIFDANGRKILAQDIGNFQGNFREQFDISKNPAGNYYLMIMQGQFSISKKFVVINL